MENIKIDWKKYFDHIWCIPYISKDRIDRYNHLLNELKRVDILDSGIFEYIYQVDSKIMNNMYENVETSYEYNNLNSHKPEYAKFTTINHYIAINISYLLGHKRILILEDDVAFLKDKQEIINILEEYKNDDAECIKYESTNPPILNKNRVWNVGAACYSLNKIGMEKMIKNIEGPHMNVIDQYFATKSQYVENFKQDDYNYQVKINIIDHPLNWKPTHKFICIQNFNPYVKSVFADVLDEYNDIIDSCDN